MRTARHTQRSWPHNRDFGLPHSIVRVIAVRRRFLGAQRRYNPHFLFTTRALANTRPRIDVTRLSAGKHCWLAAGSLLARRSTPTPLWPLLLVARPNSSAGCRYWMRCSAVWSHAVQTADGGEGGWCGLELTVRGGGDSLSLSAPIMRSVDSLSLPRVHGSLSLSRVHGSLSLSRVRSRVRERMPIALAGLTNEP